MKKNFILFLCLFTSLLFVLPACAHKPSDSYITLKKVNGVIEGQWDIAVRDLEYAIGIDKNNDGIITWSELRDNHKKISDYALSHFKMKTSDGYCTNQVIEQLVDNHSDGAYTILRFSIDCPGKDKTPKVFNLDYSLFFDVDPQHRGLLNIQHKGKTLTSIFSPDKQIQHFDLNKLTFLRQFLDFCREGIWHIWIGFDHILFLLALLLPSVLIRKNNQWEPINDFKSAFRSVFGVVTAFTLAHSVTLSLAVLGFVQLPSRLVESLIAASVILAAVNNIFPVLKDGRWIAAYCFGLIHGFGFASALMDIGLPKESLLISLFSFNLGVEIGQMSIVFLFLPIAYKIRNSFMYQKLIFITGSVIIALLASVWFTERAFNLKLLILK